jgi:transcriptional regulator with XRE-family HTH domain
LNAFLIDHLVGAQICLGRITHGWTIDDLSDQTAISPLLLREIESGRTRAGAARLYCLSRTMRLPVSYFFSGLEVTADDSHALHRQAPSSS